MKFISIYIHIPFCIKKCQYCDFLSAPADSRTQEVYLRALKKEITDQAPLYSDYEIKTIFIGGGTPTAVPYQMLCEIVNVIFQHYRVSPLAEISMEANPGTVTKEALLSYRKAGINRLSIGLQSADNGELKLLGRIHTYEEFLQTYHFAEEAGFTNINIDIMSALPGQSVGCYRQTVEKVLALKPSHISAYSLIVEEGTPFYEKYGQESEKMQATGEKQPDLPSEEEEREMYAMTEDMLGEAGYHRYEISNYALPGKECRHNIVYWERGNYVGFGLGAASLVENVRFENTRELQEYLRSLTENGERRENQHPLSMQEQMEETMFLGLRLTKGVSKAEFLRNFGVSMEKIYGKIIEENAAQNLLTEDAEYVRLTKEGMDLSNYVMAQFLLDGD